MRTARIGGQARRASSTCSRAIADPEARFRQYGSDFGKKGHTVDPADNDWIYRVPQIRVRMADDRAKDQFGELTVLNERLAGQESWEIRKRVEYLKRKKAAWKSVYQSACEQDTALTLNALEKAIAEVDAALADGQNEFKSIAETKSELLALQEQVEDAHERLHVTQARVEQNVKRITDLKREAVEITRINRLSAEDMTAAARASVHPEVIEAMASQGGLTSDRVATKDIPSTSAFVTAEVPRAARVTRKSKGLSSTLNLESGLRNFWYAVAFSSKLKPDMLVPVELFGESWVIFRDETGAAAAVYDECAHRACPLSLGTVENGEVQCAYHGWTFNSQGECTKMPSTIQCKGIQVAHLPTVEKDGFVWVWAGEGEPVEVPDNTLPPGDDFTLHAEIEVEVPVEHGLLMENLLDLAHAPFTHTSTFAKGWPVPDAVRFHTQRLLAGNWDPYPIDMSFEPPCMVLSMIGLKQPGQIEAGTRAEECTKHLHQLHVCLPSRKGHTRLLYRMSLDFMPWVKHVPGISLFWDYIAGQVLGEDLVLVKGQQERMARGGDTWSHPVSYDKLAVRYRRWRNDVGESAVIPAELYNGQKMNAGALFSVDDEDAGVFIDENCDDSCSIGGGKA